MKIDKNSTIIHYYAGFPGMRRTVAEQQVNKLVDAIDKKHNITKVKR